MEIKKIGVEFKDNDFHSTMYGIMYGLAWNKPESLVDEELENFKRRIERVIKNSLYGVYKVWQNQEEYPDFNIPRYFDKKPVKVFVNEEVDAYIKNNFLNGEFFVTDWTYKGDKTFNAYVYSA